MEFARAEQRDGRVCFPNGLCLALPTRPGCLARLGGFDVLSVLGEGGMGMVLKGHDERLQRDVALKVISPRWLYDQPVRQRFLGEARAAAKLKHPNIVTIYAVDEDGDMPFIVMEYIRGKSLALLIAEEGRLPPAVAARIAEQILAALGHAHREGIIHRDVKPGNVLLDDQNALVKLVDFGLARGVAEAARHTAAGATVGTPWYMSPEQVSGEQPLDPRSDLFSVGVVLFEMLVGTLPFPGQDVGQVLEQIRTGDTPDPCRINPAVPRQLAEIVRRALEKDRARRFQSAAEFAEALRPFLASAQSTTASPQVAASGAPLRRRWLAVPPARTLWRRSSPLPVSCEICQTPICSKCWNARGRKRCSKHAEQSKPAARPPAGRRPLPSLRTVLPTIAAAPPQAAAAPADVPAQPAVTPAARVAPLAPAAIQPIVPAPPAKSPSPVAVIAPSGPKKRSRRGTRTLTANRSCRRKSLPTRRSRST